MLACHFDLTLQLGMCTDGGVTDPRELGHSGWSAFLVCFLAGAIAHRGHSTVSRRGLVPWGRAQFDSGRLESSWAPPLYVVPLGLVGTLEGFQGRDLAEPPRGFISESSSTDRVTA